MTAALPPEDAALRRILDFQFVPDANKGGPRPSSSAFARRPDEKHASCFIRSLLDDNNLEDSDVLNGHEDLGLVEVPIYVFRAYDFDVVEDPDGVNPDRPHRCDVAHGAIVEPKGVSPSRLKSTLGKLAKRDEVVVLKQPKLPSEAPENSLE